MTYLSVKRYLKQSRYTFGNRTNITTFKGLLSDFIRFYDIKLTTENVQYS